MSNVRFVVWFGRPEETKVFERREDARSYAEDSVAFGQQAEIRRVELSADMDEAKMNRAAVAAMGMGESELVEAISHPIVKEREQQRIVYEQRKAEWEADFRNDPVNREIVALKVVRDLTAIHIPEPGRKGSKKYYQRQRLAERVLASTIPRTVERFRNQMDSLVAVCRPLLADNGDYRKLAQTSDLNGFTPDEIRAALAKRPQKGTAPKLLDDL